MQKILIIIVIACSSILAQGATFKSCEISANVDNCVFAIVNDEGQKISRCYSESESINGVDAKKLFDMQGSGICPAYDMCEISANDSKCVYAIVNEDNKRISKCYNSFDHNRGVVIDALIGLHITKKCKNFKGE